MIAALISLIALFVAFAVWFAHRDMLFAYFCAVMRLQETRDGGKLTPRGRRFGTRVLLWGGLLDISYNLSWAIIEFADFPRETTVTYRLKRYKYGLWPLPPPDGVRFYSIRHFIYEKRFAIFKWRLAKTEAYATDLLDPNDPSGKHV